MSLFALLTIFGALLASTPLPAKESEGLDSLVILSFNVREWSRDTDKEKETFWKNRMEAMKKMIEEVSPDVICFQELMPPATRYVPDGYKSVTSTSGKTSKLPVTVFQYSGNHVLSKESA